MKKRKLSDCPTESKVRMKPNTVILTVQMHVNGQTRLLTGNGTDGAWRDSNEEVYLENQQQLSPPTPVPLPPAGWGKKH